MEVLGKFSCDLLTSIITITINNQRRVSYTLKLKKEVRWLIWVKKWDQKDIHDDGDETKFWRYGCTNLNSVSKNWLSL